jgi:hypothetical protein
MPNDFDWLSTGYRACAENLGRSGGPCCLQLPIYLHWSSAASPTQAKIRLEWGTQPLLLVQGVGVKAAVS